MPRYFFHTRNGAEFPDQDGTELADDNAARTEAIVTAGSVLKDLGRKFWSGQGWSMLVVSETGETVCELLLTARSGGHRNSSYTAENSLALANFQHSPSAPSSDAGSPD